MDNNFDKRDVYNREIHPIVQTLLKKCNENRIPFFVAFGVGLEDGEFRRGDGLRCTTLLPEVIEVAHNDPCFAGFVKIVNGANAFYPEEQYMETEDFDDEFDENAERSFEKIL